MSLQNLLVPAVVVLTSVAAYVVGRMMLGLPARGIHTAWGEALEVVGAALVFLVVNTAAVVALALATRLLTRGFLSVYVVEDPMLLTLSLLEALVFRLWRRTVGPPKG